MTATIVFTRSSMHGCGLVDRMRKTVQVSMGRNHSLGPRRRSRQSPGPPLLAVTMKLSKGEKVDRRKVFPKSLSEIERQSVNTALSSEGISDSLNAGRKQNRGPRYKQYYSLDELSNSYIVWTMFFLLASFVVFFFELKLLIIVFSFLEG